MARPLPALRPSLSSGALPPLSHDASEGFRLAHSQDPMHSVIEIMAQSPLKKRLDLNLSASVEKAARRGGNLDVNDENSIGDIRMNDYLELEVLISSKMKELEALTTPNGSSTNIPSSAGSTSSVLSTASTISNQNHSITPLPPSGERAPKQPRSNSRQSSTRSVSNSPAPSNSNSNHNNNNNNNNVDSAGILQQVREGYILFKASLREVSLQLGVHCPERARLIMRTFDFYSLLLQKVQPFLEVLESCSAEANDLREKWERETAFRRKIKSRVGKQTFAKQSDGWENMVESAMEEIESLQNDKANLQNHISQITADLTKSREETKGLKTQIQGLEEQLRKLTDSLEQEQQETERLRNVVEEANAEIESQKKEGEEKMNQQAKSLESQHLLRLAEIQKQLCSEKQKLSASETSTQQNLKDLEREKQLSLERKDACDAAGGILRQCLTTMVAQLKDEETAPQNMTKGDPSDNSPPILKELSSSFMKTFSSLVSRLEKITTDFHGAKEKLSLQEENVATLHQEIGEWKEKYQNSSQALSAMRAAKPIMTDVSVEATGSNGMGRQERGVQTWGSARSNGEEDEKKASRREEDEFDESMSLSGGSNRKANVEPLSAFMLRYLQRRFGLLEVNAEWEVGRLRQNLGRVLDVYVRSTAGADNDET